MSQADNLAALATNVNSSGVLQPASGGTGLTSPGSNGNVLTSNGTAWVSSTPGTYSQWTTTGSDIYYNTGNVGIGTSSPGNKLEISGGSIRTINNTSGRITFNNGSTEAFLGFNGAGLTVLDSGALPLSIYTQGANYLTLGTNSTERMRIDSSGNVGIGTSSVFDGNTRLELSKSGNCQQFISSTDASGVRIYLSAQGSTSANFGAFSNHALSFRTNDTERGRFDTSGNFLFNSGYGSVATAYGCRAWVNFNGQTNAIRASGNVSSISDRGFGLYTVNFTNAMPDTNYSVSGIISSDVTTQAIIFIGSTNADVLTSSVRIDACNPNVGNIERQVMCIQIFR